MSVRIRYKNNETFLRSQNNYVIPDGRVVYVTIMVDPVPTLSVQEVDSPNVLHSETVDTVRRAKEQAKKALETLGLVFNSEVRKKRSESNTEGSNGQEG